MARSSAKFEVTIQSLSGVRKVKVAVGTTVAKFKSDNDIASTAKIFDDEGELASNSILTSQVVTVVIAKKNG